MLKMLCLAIPQLQELHRRRELLRELLAHSDHELEDVGLHREDIEGSLGLLHPPSARELAGALSALR